MRPVHLEVKGFSAFRETAAISFEGADLVAFVGPTGSGKSSLIDAMTFALYGTVARYDDQRLVEPVINQLSTEARVRLDFELAGERYTAVRVATRTKTGATTKEARLIHVHGDGTETAVAGSAREMGPAVGRLVGLDFEQFTRTVVLPQGAFAVFLHADKSTRQKLLRQLLDVTVYEQMGRLARDRMSDAQGRLSLSTDQLEALPEVTSEELDALDTRVTALTEMQVTIAEQLAGLAELDGAIAEAGAVVAALSKTAASLRKVAVPDAVATLAPLIAAAEAEQRDAIDALDAARAARDQAQVELSNAPDVADVKARLGCVAAIARLAGDIEALVPQESAATEAVVAAGSVAAAAATALEQAEVVHQKASTAAGLGAAIEALVVGEPCPVCTQTVQTLPAHDVDKELREAKKALKDAKAASRDAAAALSSVQGERTSIAAKLDALRLQLDQESARFGDLADEATLVGQLEAAEAAKSAFDRALAAAGEAEKAEAMARTTLEAHQRKEVALRQELSAARDGVADRKPPTPEGRSLQEDWTVFVAWAGEQAVEVERELAEATAQVGERTASKRQLVDAVEQACASVGVTAPVGQVAERIAAELVRAEHALTGARDREAKRAELVGTIAELEETVALDKEMGLLLSTRGFERWLVQSALDDLLARATGRLFELSGGQFSFESEDGEFSICDHRNADEVRSVRSLSGGETFLASLALALALAEAIADLAVEGAPRLESMFLDEGFGTLDDDARDLVATTLEELSASGRLIGIVTHIRDLADRMPVRFEVSKDALTSRVDRVEV